MRTKLVMHLEMGDCGWAWTTTSPARVTRDPARVTCKTCRRGPRYYRLAREAGVPCSPPHWGPLYRWAPDAKAAEALNGTDPEPPSAPAAETVKE